MNVVHVNSVTSCSLFVTVKDREGNPADVSGAEDRRITLTRPDGSFFTHNGEFETDGKDGKLKLTVTKEQLDVVGIWKCQGRSVLSDESPCYADEIEFEVK